MYKDQSIIFILLMILSCECNITYSEYKSEKMRIQYNKYKTSSTHLHKKRCRIAE